MEAPDEWLERCHDCDGSGTVEVERRDQATRPRTEIGEAFDELRAAWLEQALARARAEQECDKLREQLSTLFFKGDRMKPMEWKITITTDGPMDAAALLEALHDLEGVKTAEITSYRVVTEKRKPKSAAVVL